MIPTHAVVAWQFTDESKNQVFNNTTCHRYPDFDQDGNPTLRIRTPEGTEETAHFGDWVVKVGEGKFYVMSNEQMMLIEVLPTQNKRSA